MPHGLDVLHVVKRRLLVVAHGPVGVLDAGLDGGIDPPRSPIRRQRGLKQAAKAARHHETGEEMRIRCASPHPLQQPHHGLGCPALLLDLEIGIEVVCDREVGVDLQRPAKRLLRERHALDLPLRAVLREHPIDPAQSSPRRRVVRVLLEALPIEVAGHREPGRIRGVGTEVIGAEVQVVGLRVDRLLAAERAAIAGRERERQRVHDLPGQVVLELEQVGERDLRRAGGQQRAEGASSICVETRTWSPARSSVPVTTTSTPASAAWPSSRSRRRRSAGRPRWSEPRGTPAPRASC